MNTAKKLVYLRERKDISKPDSAISLFLDYKDGSGKRIREILKGYILSPSNKQYHKEIRAKAELLRVQKERELLQGDFDIQIKQKNILFTPFMSDLAETKPNNRRNFLGAAKHLENHSPGIRIQNITSEFLENFRKYLQKEGLKENTTKTYLSKIRVTLKTALREKIIFKYPAEGFKIGKYEAKPVYLSSEEVKTLLKTPCKNENVKRIFIFQLLTALRISDVRKLVWGDIQGDRINFRQSKTRELHEIIISPQLAGILGLKEGIIPINKTECLFDVPSLNFLNRILRLWGEAAGLPKRLTTHVARHTAATHLLRTGSDIKTVSQTLGHKDLTSTMIYIHAIDKERERAANKLGELISV